MISALSISIETSRLQSQDNKIWTHSASPESWWVETTVATMRIFESSNGSACMIRCNLLTIETSEDSKSKSELIDSSFIVSCCCWFENLRFFFFQYNENLRLSFSHFSEIESKVSKLSSLLLLRICKRERISEETWLQDLV